MRIKVLIGLGLIILCGYIGSLIHFGTGSAVVIDSIIGIVLFCILISKSTNKLWPFSSKANQQQQVVPDISQEDIEKASAEARRDRVYEDMRLELRKW